jgi:tRNA-splicing ligase RtcB (3'-phosphate/5'-hydroxy nucleic acid ligase)
VSIQIRRTAPYEYEIPLSGAMRVPGRIFADPSLILRAQEDKALEQVANVATLPGIVVASMAMPDVHWGYGFPVGGVAATDVAEGGVISPGGVGFDVCCGVRLLRSSLSASDVGPRIETLLAELAKRIPRGTGRGGLVELDAASTRSVLSHGVDALLERGFGVASDASFCEDGGRMDAADPDAVSERAVARGSGQLGSLGGGNHFLEIQAVDEIYDGAAADAMGLQRGTIAVMMHTGSRGLGHQVCTDEIRVFDEVMRREGIRVPDRQLACGPVTSPEGSRYLAAMAAAANFARANRHLLAHEVRACFERVFGDGDLPLVYDVAHNLAKLEEHGGRTLCVHRKGATRAFGPGHPEVPEAYRDIGQPVLIPGSMGTVSYVLAGMAESLTKSFASTCHGAGRAMSRTQAKKRMGGRELARELAAAGILVDATNPGLLAEEAPYAYKDVSAVVETCEGARLSRKVARLRPLAVLKG